MPKFKSEDAERNFWAKINLADYFVPEDFSMVSFPNLKPTSRPISLRLPDPIISRVKEKANRLNVPYQSLMKQYIAEGVGRD
ncbi:MAG: hypothetical protein COV07_00960 [Candidatus Vogelbacteria bacterium CG10_big_fil_rev_8_21_14_0_10_45_14]|uniref:CopG family transcriptional regulator n=1 Tax=Candidatus Vogelbacteria bacterium CG10_big_fil_rev_8_21_14_0_10_45_14 TaxID=1975042 RepID=A0A2H0RKR5_9BACT|nr:MAG: hypothetical protein COV07_00960 [Candidatus Vogelbacteria bacterium CG10_big_fil_rev_8_21_14_0_10_45_14]